MLIFKEEALQEIRQAQLWYEVQQPGLGERFRRDLIGSLRFVLENPPGFGIRKDPYRPVLLERFPYIVWYAVEGDDIVVYRVRHGKRKPLRKFTGR
jgi:plasmid stabilization system protein ParE